MLTTWLKSFIFKPLLSLVLVCTSLFLFDQFFKYQVRHQGGPYVCNYGISFGIIIPSAYLWLILSIVFFLIITYLFFSSAFKKLSPLFPFGAGLFIGGAISNFLDRLLFGCVIDYISLGWKFFPSFNLADIAISLGGFILFFTVLSKKHTCNVNKL